MNVVQSLAQDKKSWNRTELQKRYSFSSAFRECDSRQSKHGQMRSIHSFNPNPQMEAAHWWWSRRSSHMIVKRFGCTAIHNKALYKCIIHSFADGTADCVYRQWFLEAFLGPFSNVNDRIMPMSDAVSSEGPNTTGRASKKRSSALSLTHRDFSSFSESFDDVMHCRWWD